MAVIGGGRSNLGRILEIAVLYIDELDRMSII